MGREFVPSKWRGGPARERMSRDASLKFRHTWLSVMLSFFFVLFKYVSFYLRVNWERFRTILKRVVITKRNINTSVSSTVVSLVEYILETFWQIISDRNGLFEIFEAFLFFRTKVNSQGLRKGLLWYCRKREGFRISINIIYSEFWKSSCMIWFFLKVQPKCPKPWHSFRTVYSKSGLQLEWNCLKYNF